MKYIDIHSHLHDTAFDSDRENVLARMRAESIATITVGTGLSSSRAAVALAMSEPDVWATVGVHPNDDPDEAFDGRAFTELARHPKVVAIGECGLDFFKTDGDSDGIRQRELFAQHIALAEEAGLPLMLHVRDAYEEVLDILEAGNKNISGNVHFFAGDSSIAKRFFNLGFTISFTGVISFTRAYDDVIEYAPENMIMVETDAPYVAPVPYRGKRNEPTHVIYVAQRIAEIKKRDIEDMRNVFVVNTKRVFPRMGE